MKPEKPKQKDIIELRKEFTALAETLSAEGLQAAIEAARPFMMSNQLETNADKPQFYRERPVGEDLVQFLRREYQQKGFIVHGFDRAALKLYDPSCLKAIEHYEQRKGLLPEDVRIPKARKRLSFRERALKR